MNVIAQRIVGPRTPAELKRNYPLRYRLPAGLLAAAAGCLLISLFLPYWQITMFAPQYPAGLTVTSFVNRMAGRVDEVNILNQYIGMKPLETAAPVEKRFAVTLIVALALLVVAAVKIHSPFAAWLSLPAILYPLIFLGDFWSPLYRSLVPAPKGDPTCGGIIRIEPTPKAAIDFLRAYWKD